MRASLRTASLATKLGTIAVVLLVLALGSISFTLWVTWQLEGGAAAVNEAGRLRMQTWRLAQAAGSADTSRARVLVDEFDRSLALLEAGDPARPLFVPHDAATAEAFVAVRSGWDALRPRWREAGPDPRAAAEADMLVMRIDTFVGAIEAQLARRTAVLSMFQFGLMALAIAGGVAMLYAAVLLIFNPLGRLKSGLARIERGELSARIEEGQDDEFGRLAGGFNRMAAKIEESARALEDRVRQKTETLRAERERLSVLYDASAFVARAPTLEALAQGFARRMRAAARADAALLRWYDVEAQRYVLIASDCVPAELLEAERCVHAGECHCGSTPPAGGTRVIPIESGGGQVSHCERHGYTRVMTVPVRLHEQSLGEADLLFRGTSDTTTDADRALVETLAAHLASGMEGLRAAALEREAAVAEERGLLARELHDSIAQALAFLKIQVQLLRGATRRGDAAAVQATIDELDTGVRECTADVRELLVHFRTRTNGEDIVPALKTTLQKFRHQTGLATHLDVHGAGVPLAADVQVQLLHVVQEALSNVRKHAGASQVWLDVQQQPSWRIEVRDDGRGFSGAAADRDEMHVGLRIMRERAAGIGAQVRVESKPGAGTRVVVVLPEAAEAAAA